MIESLLDEDLQLRVGEHLTPGKISEGGGVGRSLQGIHITYCIADDAFGVDLRTLIFGIDAATAEEEGKQKDPPPAPPIWRGVDTPLRYFDVFMFYYNYLIIFII